MFSLRPWITEIDIESIYFSRGYNFFNSCDIKQRYFRRETCSKNKRYSFFNEANFFIYQERQKKIIDLLRRNNFEELEDKKILDIGCGNGGWLRDFVQWGAHSENLYGIDLLKDRIEEAKKINPNFNFLCANAEKLDFDDKSFDIVIVATCFTSILDAKMKKNIAREILRVVKIGGIILWYDFRFDNPWNPDVKGIEKKEINIMV